MSDRIQLQCGCGAVGIEVEGAPIMSTECLCTSCRMAADLFEALPGAPRLRAATGGTRTEMYRKDRIRCFKGAASLRAHRLNAKTKTRRVVATCCNTPMFMDFTAGHWVDLYSLLWPAGTLPPLQMRTMAADHEAPSALPDDVPNHKTHSAGFFLHLTWAWAAMGFRRPKIDDVNGKLDIRS